MPKIVTEAEREQTREAIYKATLAQIAQKGLRKVTVDGIAAAVGIGKGSFYTYYPSREVCVYEAVHRWEHEQFAKLEAAMARGSRGREHSERVLRELFLPQGGILFSLSPIDVEALLRKLPPEYREREQQKSVGNFARALELLRVDEEKMEAIASLTDCLSMVAGNSQYSERGKKQALDALIAAIASLLPEAQKEAQA